MTWFWYQYKAISRLHVLNQLVRCQEVYFIRYRPEQTRTHLILRWSGFCTHKYSPYWLDQWRFVSSKPAVHTLRCVLCWISRQLAVLWLCKKAKFLVDSWLWYQRFSVYLKHGEDNTRNAENTRKCNRHVTSRVMRIDHPIKCGFLSRTLISMVARSSYIACMSGT